MNHADAGNAPSLPANLARYIASPKFHLCCRHLLEGVTAGAYVTRDGFCRLLGMSEEDFGLYLSFATDLNGSVLLPLGDDEYWNMVWGDDDFHGPAAEAAMGSDEKAAIGALVPRLLFLRRFSRKDVAPDGLTIDYTAADGLMIGYLDTPMPCGAILSHIDVLDLTPPVLSPSLFGITINGPVEHRRFDGPYTLRRWSRGWENRLF